MSRCFGQCCKSVALPMAPGELMANYRAWRDGAQRDAYGRPPIRDIHIIAPSMRYLGKHQDNPMPDCAEDIPSGLPPRHYYSCRLLEANGDCSIYEDRPEMCRRYPSGSACTYKTCGQPCGGATA